MRHSITSNTEIHMVVNGKTTFIIENSPETGLLWITKSGMNREAYIQAYIQGLYAITEAAHNISMNKIRVDAKRISESTKPFEEG